VEFDRWGRVLQDWHHFVERRSLGLRQATQVAAFSHRAAEFRAETLANFLLHRAVERIGSVDAKINMLQYRAVYGNTEAIILICSSLKTRIARTPPGSMRRQGGSGDKSGAPKLSVFDVSGFPKVAAVARRSLSPIDEIGIRSSLDV